MSAGSAAAVTESGQEEALIASKDVFSPACRVDFSSYWADDHTAYELDNANHPNGKTQAWSARSNDSNQWIQVQAEAPVEFRGVTTQGRGDQDQWVTEYQVYVSDDGISWRQVVDRSGQNLFKGNTDRNTHQRVSFMPAIGRFLRLNPVQWHAHISIRWEVYGVPKGGVVPIPVPNPVVSPKWIGEPTKIGDIDLSIASQYLALPTFVRTLVQTADPAPTEMRVVVQVQIGYWSGGDQSYVLHVYATNCPKQRGLLWFHRYANTAWATNSDTMDLGINRDTAGLTITYDGKEFPTGDGNRQASVYFVALH